MTHQYFTTKDGVKLAYRDEGEGPALLCLSGLTRNGSDFEYVRPHLKGMRVIRPDYRGRGASDWADHQSYTVLQEAEDQLALLDHLGIVRTAILGTSRGGLIAMCLAATAKDRLTGVCLNDIGPAVDMKGRKFIMTYLGKRPPQKTYEAAAKARATHLRDFPGVPMDRWMAEVKNHYVEDEKGLNITYDPRLRDIVAETNMVEPQPDLWPWFDALAGLPLALIRGANSDLLAMETAGEMQRRRPDMLFANVADRGHVPFLDEPQSLDIIGKFLEQLR